MKRRHKKIYEGTSKSLYETDEDFHFMMSFGDNLKLGNQKNIEIAGKGALNNAISAILFSRLDMVGIDHHFLEKLNMREQKIYIADAFPVQIYVNNIACGRYVEEFGLEKGYVFGKPLIDFRIKSREINYPVVGETHISAFDWMAEDEIEFVKEAALRINDFLTGFFAGVGLRLAEIKLEFGRTIDQDGIAIILIDEISPDTCRLWDIDTNKPMCFEIAEQGPDALINVYQEVLERIEKVSFNLP